MPPTKERVALQKDELQFAPTGVEITPIHNIFANYR